MDTLFVNEQENIHEIAEKNLTSNFLQVSPLDNRASNINLNIILKYSI